jgi:hypothetical protein
MGISTMSHIMKLSLVFGAAFFVAGCTGGGTGNRAGLIAIGEDRGLDRGSLSQLEAGIYIDPDGCHIWMIDDGVEGYWSRRRDPVSGLPVCTPVAPPNSVIGDIRAGSTFQDFTPGF